MGQKGSKIRITEQDRAVLQLKQSKDAIHKYTRRTDELIGSEKNELKLLIRNNPHNYKQNKKVRFLLKRVHYQEHLLDQASDQLINLENMVSNIEFKLVEAQFFQGIQNGNQILTKLNKEFKNIDDVLDEVDDQIAYQNEINDMLSQHVTGIDNYEDEIDKELEALQQGIAADVTRNMPSTEGLPKLEIEAKPEDKTKNKPLTEEIQKEPVLLA